jgi:hypothetical protein
MKGRVMTTRVFRAAAITLCAILAVGVGVAIAGSTPAQPGVTPAASGTSTTPRSNQAPSAGRVSARSSTRARRHQARVVKARIARAVDVLEPNFAILRRPQSPDDPGPDQRAATASDGTRMTVKVNEHGLCLESLGGSACGAPETAASVATVAHAVTPDGEQVSGVVPDKVKAVRVTTATGRQLDVPVQDNVFVVWLPAPETSATITWIKRDGAIEKKVG